MDHEDNYTFIRSLEYFVSSLECRKLRGEERSCRVSHSMVPRRNRQNRNTEEIRSVSTWQLFRLHLKIKERKITLLLHHSFHLRLSSPLAAGTQRDCGSGISLPHRGGAGDNLFDLWLLFVLRGQVLVVDRIQRNHNRVISVTEEPLWWMTRRWVGGCSCYQGFRWLIFNSKSGQR